MRARSIDVSGDGTRLVAIDGDVVRVINREAPTARSTGAGSSGSLARPGVATIACVGDAVWTVGGEPRALEVAGSTERVSVSAGRFVRSGAQLAWIGGGKAMLVARQGNAIETSVIGEADFALPISATRWIVARGSAIQLRDTTTQRWSVAPVIDGLVSEGAIVFDGRAAALYLEQRAGRGVIVVLGLRDGGVQHRVALQAATHVRFAPRRGCAFVVLAGERLVMIDLRFGRVLADHVLERAVVDVACDDAGQIIALRDSSGELVELDVEELLKAPRESASELALDEEEAPVEETPVAPAPVVKVIEERVSLAGCPALPVRVVAEMPTVDEMRELLAAQRQIVVGLASHALARAWDEGRATPDRAAPARNVIDSFAGMLGGLATDDVLVTATRVDAAQNAYWQTVARVAPRVPPLAQLAKELGLDALAQQIILVIAAPALWGEIATLYGLVCHDPARPLCDEHLVATILASQAFPAEIAAALDAESPLVASGIVHVGGGLQRPFLSLSIDPIVLRLLRGITTTPVAAVPFEELQIAGRVKARIRDGLARTVAGNPLRVVVRGRSGSGRHTLLGTIAGASGYALEPIDASTVEDLESALCRVRLAGRVPCMDGLERSTMQDPIVRDRVRQTIARHPGPVFVRLPAEALPPIEPGYVAIDLPAQSVGERAASWERALQRVTLSVPDSAELAARFAVGPAVIERVVERVAREPGGTATTAERIDAALRQHLDGALGATATRVERLATWSQVVLPADIQDSVTELIGRIRHRRTVFDQWGFDRVMSTSRGTTALFQGGPGTGKTLVAGAIANELGLDLYRVDVSRIMSKWIGETEQNLAKLFDAAEDGNAIILFDEADSLFTKRTEVKSSNDRHANLEVNYLLQRLDTFEGIAIMTTNFGTAIDAAFKRRLSFRLTFPFPDEEQRERLWRAHLPPQLPVRGALDLAAVAQRYRLSGGYIRNCALRAAFLAAEQGGFLTADHLERAIKAEFREIGKLAESGILE